MFYWLRLVSSSALIAMIAFLTSQYLLHTASSPKINQIVENKTTIKPFYLKKEKHEPIWRWYGTLGSEKTINLISPTLSTVKKIHIQNGSAVKINQPLIVLDQTDALYKLENTKQTIKELSINIAKTKREQESAESLFKKRSALYDLTESKTQRYQKLFDANALSKEQYEQSQMQLQQESISLQQIKDTISSKKEQLILFENQIEKALLSKNQAENDLEDLIIKSPIDGFIDQLTLAEGDQVSMGSELVAIVDHQWQITLEIPFQIALEIQKLKNSKTPVNIFAKISEQDQWLSIENITLSTTDHNDRGHVELIIKLPKSIYNNQDLFIQQGAIKEIMLTLPTRKTLWRIPPEALSRSKFIYMVDETSSLKRIEVQLVGFDKEKQWPLVESKELYDGAIIVQTPSPSLSQGQKVNIKEG